MFELWTFTQHSVVAFHLCELLQTLSYLACLSWLAQVISSVRHFRSRSPYADFCFLGIIRTQAQAQVSTTIWRNTFLFLHFCACACIANVKRDKWKQQDCKQKHRNKNIFFFVKRCNSKRKVKVTLSSENQRRRKHMHKWDANFTPMKLAQVIWPQPRTQGLSPSRLSTTEERSRSCFWSCWSLFYPQNRLFLTMLPYYITFAKCLKMAIFNTLKIVSFYYQ